VIKNNISSSCTFSERYAIRGIRCDKQSLYSLKKEIIQG